MAEISNLDPHLKVRDVVAALGFSNPGHAGIREFLLLAYKKKAEIIVYLDKVPVVTHPESPPEQVQIVTGMVKTKTPILDDYGMLEEFVCHGQLLFPRYVPPDPTVPEDPERWHPFRGCRVGIHLVTQAHFFSYHSWDLRIERAVLIRLAAAYDWRLDLLDAPPAAAKLPDGVDWHAIAAMLDPNHAKHAPELATAVHAWIRFHWKQVSKTTAVLKFAKGRGHTQDPAGRIATVANPDCQKRAPATRKPAKKI